MPILKKNKQSIHYALQETLKLVVVIFFFYIIAKFLHCFVVVETVAIAGEVSTGSVTLRHSDYINIALLPYFIACVSTQQQLLLEQSLKIEGWLGRKSGYFPLMEQVTIQRLICSIEEPTN